MRREKAEHVVSDVRGVRSISNEIAVVPDEYIFDELIAVQVMENSITLAY
jgi:hypothetical protein